MGRRRRTDDDFDRRLEDEIITDAKPDEVWMAWYWYLDDQLRFPFAGRCAAQRLTSSLRIGEVVEVQSMSPQEECEQEMFVNIRWQDRLLAVPLSQLAGVDVDDGTQQAIPDWHTWVERGHVL